MPTNRMTGFGPWYQSSYSSGGDNCVETAVTAEGTQVLVRDSKAPAEPPCVLDAAGWDALLAAVASSRPEDAPPAADPQPHTGPGNKAGIRSELNFDTAGWQPAGDVEYAFLGYPDGVTYVAFRAENVVLVFTMPEWDAFVAGVRDGEFTLDRLVREQPRSVEDTPLFAAVQAEAVRAAAVAQASGLVSDELITDRRAGALRERTDRH